MLATFALFLSATVAAAGDCRAPLLPEATTAQLNALRTQAEDPAATEGERMARIADLRAMVDALEAAGIAVEAATMAHVEVEAPPTPIGSTAPTPTLDISTLTSWAEDNDLVRQAVENPRVLKEMGILRTYTALIIAILEAYGSSAISAEQKDAWVEATFNQLENHDAARALGITVLGLLPPLRDRAHNTEDFVNRMILHAAPHNQLARALTSPAIPPLTRRQLSRVIAGTIATAHRHLDAVLRAVPSARVTPTDARAIIEHALGQGAPERLVRLRSALRPRTLAGPVTGMLPTFISTRLDVNEPTFLHYAALLLEVRAKERHRQNTQYGRRNPRLLPASFLLPRLRVVAELMKLPGVDISARKGGKTALQRIGALVRRLDGTTKERRMAPEYIACLDLFKELERL